MKHLILATAGHVDHGKTALIKALTGTDTDRLPEEKARGITIELGFAHLQLGDVSLGVIDVPGHEDFVKNMVAGVGSIDLALLVVAADDGWMPQTEEHLQILEYLGVKPAVIALAKCDLATPPNDSIRSQLEGTSFAEASLVPVSVRTGDGLEELKAEIARVCSSIPPQRDIGKPRLAVDRAFTLRGVGLVVTGTLSGGKLRRGDEIVVQPSGQVGRIRAMQSHGSEVVLAEPGMRTALSIPGVEIRRGDVITAIAPWNTSEVIDMFVTRSSRLPANARPIKNGAVVRVHHGTAASPARIFFANGEPLGRGQSKIAELRFDAPVFAFAGDRFVLRDSSEQQTLAGAHVLDPDASARRFRSPSQQELLAARAATPDDATVFVRTQLQRDHAVPRRSLLLQSRFSAVEIEGASAEAKIADESVCDPEWWRAVCARAASLIQAEHKAHPNHLGFDLARLREALASDLPSAELFDALIAELCAHGFVRSNDTIRQETHRPSLPGSLQTTASRIRAALATNPFDPPSSKALAPDAAGQQALRFLRETNEIVEITADLVIGRVAVEQMRDKIAGLLRANGGATVSELRQALGSSRRVVVPLLEYFDRTGVTRRVGDKRFLVSPR
jgi:selenocysteine-specific elongation factor